VEFKFINTKQYFTVSEERHLKEFYELMLSYRGSYIYENSKGEKYEVGKVDYPEEVVIPNETHYGPRLESGGNFYSTPIATLVGKKKGIVHCLRDGEWKVLESDEFLKWLGKDYKVTEKPKPEQPKFIADRLAMAQSMSKAKVETKEELEEKVENWNPEGKTLTSKKKKKSKKD